MLKFYFLYQFIAVVARESKPYCSFWPYTFSRVFTQLFNYNSSDFISMLIFSLAFFRRIISSLRKKTLTVTFCVSLRRSQTQYYSFQTLIVCENYSQTCIEKPHVCSTTTYYQRTFEMTTHLHGQVDNSSVRDYDSRHVLNNGPQKWFYLCPCRCYRS